MSYFITGWKSPANREMPVEMIKNPFNRPGGGRTPKYAYYDPEMTEPRRAEKPPHPGGGAEDSASQGAGSTEGAALVGREAGGIEFGEGFEGRNQARQGAQQTVFAETLPAEKSLPHSFLSGLSPKTARGGIILSEILGPPKGRAYFHRHFGGR